MQPRPGSRATTAGPVARTGLWTSARSRKPAGLSVSRAAHVLPRALSMRHAATARAAPLLANP
eukprot:15444342-Alexandrium_andersonii.AAC.1